MAKTNKIEFEGVCLVINGDGYDILRSTCGKFCGPECWDRADVGAPRLKFTARKCYLKNWSTKGADPEKKLIGTVLKQDEKGNYLRCKFCKDMEKITNEENEKNTVRLALYKEEFESLLEALDSLEKAQMSHPAKVKVQDIRRGLLSQVKKEED